MKKYFQIMNVTVAEYTAYRLNFLFWRFRMVLQLLVVYFLWWALFSVRSQYFGYTQSMLLTYVLLTSVVRTLILGTTTMDIPTMINRGDLSNYLLKPISFFRYFGARDIADKLLNTVFSAVEITVLIALLRPQIVVQTDMLTVMAAVAAVCIGAFLYFFFSLLIGFLGFWVPDVWSVRFLTLVIMDFFAGGMFPLDILPGPLYAISRLLPFYYFIYYPLKVYLNGLHSPGIWQGFVVGLAWVAGLWYLARLVFRKGLAVYGAEGR